MEYGNCGLSHLTEHSFYNNLQNSSYFIINIMVLVLQKKMESRVAYLHKITKFAQV